MLCFAARRISIFDFSKVVKVKSNFSQCISWVSLRQTPLATTVGTPRSGFPTYFKLLKKLLILKLHSCNGWIRGDGVDPWSLSLFSRQSITGKFHN